MDDNCLGKQSLLCLFLLMTILLTAWFLHPILSISAQGGNGYVYLPLIIKSMSPTSPLYGVIYPLESDLPEIAALNVKLVVMQANSPQDALTLLDMVASYDMHMILRIGDQSEHGIDWGWDGSQFDLSPLADFESVIGGHPALFAVIGLDEPWKRFNADQLRQFYDRWRAIAPALLLFHHFGHMHPAFSGGMADICSIAAFPHRWDSNGDPINLYDSEVRQKVTDAQTFIAADPDAILCVTAQAHGQDSMPDKKRFPAPDEMRENASIIADEFNVDCMLWYAWTGAYHRLGDPEFEEQRQVVAETYDLYFQ